MATAPGPSLTLLIKLLKMTTSSSDGEALVAARKANAELAKFGGDWETLLRGKVTVIGDPFVRKPDPDVTPSPTPQPPPATRRRGIHTATAPRWPMDAAYRQS